MEQRHYFSSLLAEEFLKIYNVEASCPLAKAAKCRIDDPESPTLDPIHRFGAP